MVVLLAAERLQDLLPGLIGIRRRLKLADHCVGIVGVAELGLQRSELCLITADEDHGCTGSEQSMRRARSYIASRTKDDNVAS